jgi:hypothetical protein
MPDKRDRTEVLRLRRDITKLLKQGFSDKEIARQLHTNLGNIRRHKERLERKKVASKPSARNHGTDNAPLDMSAMTLQEVWELGEEQRRARYREVLRGGIVDRLAAEPLPQEILEEWEDEEDEGVDRETLEDRQWSAARTALHIVWNLQKPVNATVHGKNYRSLLTDLEQELISLYDSNFLDGNS